MRENFSIEANTAAQGEKKNLVSLKRELIKKKTA
jgi:hypothetical protein